jgi:hypothetical protein
MKVINCYTLFDITCTHIRNRNIPNDIENPKDWISKRNSQCNFDTVLQAISMRSQPEQITEPEKIDISFDSFEKFGFLFQQLDEIVYHCWEFSFTIQHQSVFDDGINELGLLYNDCHGIPMLHTGNEFKNLSNFLDASEELRNIYFEVVNA